ncbi:MAG: prepilin-type N-terminal cleavage/methylation domain-containing protein [Desulfomonilaceae bacterium]
MRSTLGFTLAELMVVLAIAGILVFMGLAGYNHYKDQYAFSGAVRELTHAITVARVRAIQSQTTSRLLFRPLQANPVPSWTGPPNHPAQQYNVGDIVQLGPWTYRCILAHVSTADTEPAAGANWRTDWEIIYDYQCNSLPLDVQHCPQSNNCVDANPFVAASPVSIQFNWSGVPVDYIPHDIVVQGAWDLAKGQAQTVGNVTITVTALGRIQHQGENR